METNSLSIYLEKQGYSLDEIMLLIILKEFRFLKKLNYDNYSSSKFASEVQVVLYSKSKPSIHFIWTMDGSFNAYIKENSFFSQKKIYCNELIKSVHNESTFPTKIDFSLMQPLISDFANLFEQNILSRLK